MKKLFLLAMICVLTACSTKSVHLSNKDIMQAPIQSMTADFVRKDYKIVGVVSGDYEKVCFLFNLFCSNDIFIYDDLMRKAEKKGANAVINVVRDSQNSFWLWQILYEHQHYRANGLAVILTPEDLAQKRGNK